MVTTDRIRVNEFQSPARFLHPDNAGSDETIILKGGSRTNPGEKSRAVVNAGQAKTSVNGRSTRSTRRMELDAHKKVSRYSNAHRPT